MKVCVSKSNNVLRNYHKLGLVSAFGSGIRFVNCHPTRLHICAQCGEMESQTILIPDLQMVGVALRTFGSRTTFGGRGTLGRTLDIVALGMISAGATRG